MKNTTIINDSFEITKIIISKIDELISNAPYHLNIIDELHANENAHSRIFSKILQYKDNATYPFLISFLNCIDIDEKVVSPIITVEKGRIDSLIRDNNYVVIIENKINYASDQHEQILRYVNQVRNEYPIEKIYVLYLTRWGIKEVSSESLPDDLKNSLGDRYKPINFRYDILNWLENSVIINCKIKDKYLISAVEQYIDYLKGMFNIRNNTKSMNNQINKTIMEILDVNENSESFDTIINKKANDLQYTLNNIRSLQISRRNRLRKEFLVKLYNKLGEENWTKVNAVYNTEQDYNSKSFGFKNIEDDLQLNISNKEVFLSFEIQNWRLVLCGIFTNRDEEINEKLVQFFEDKNISIIDSKWWIYLNPEKFAFDGKNIGFDFYNDDFNFLFLDKTDELVEIYYNRIINIRGFWQEFCQIINH